MWLRPFSVVGRLCPHDIHAPRYMKVFDFGGWLINWLVDLQGGAEEG